MQTKWSKSCDEVIKMQLEVFKSEECEEEFLQFDN